MLKKLERLYVIVCLPFFAGGLIPVRAEEGVTIEDDSAALVLIQYVIFAILAFLAFYHRKRILSGLTRAKGVLLVCAICCASTFWSIDPIFTARRSILLCMTTLFAVYFAERFEWEEQLDIFSTFIVVEVFASLLLALVAPEYAVSQDLHAGAWRGLFTHKNNFGRFAGLAVLFLLSVRPPRLSQRWRWFIFAVAGLEVLLTRSSTAILATGVTLLLIPAMKLLRVKTKGTVPLWLSLTPLLVGGAALILLNGDNFLDVIGKDVTLTGRIPIWTVLLRWVALRPWFGYGFEAFFEPRNLMIESVRKELHVVSLPHGHNGFIDCLMDFGIVGLSALLFVFFRAFGQALSLFRKNLVPGNGWPILFLLFFLFFNLAESTLLRVHAFLWIPFVWVYMTIGHFRSMGSGELDAIPEETLGDETPALAATTA